jgi:uncharacterized lipoprotein YmbA
MNPIKILTPSLLALALGSCSSAPPLQFFTLASVTPAGPQLTGAFQPATVGNVTLPQVLDRQQIVRNAGGTQIMIADGQRWAAPLDDMTQRVLQEDLEKLLPQNTLIVGDNAANDPSLAVINVDVDTFESDLAGHVELDAHWSVVKGNPTATLVRSSAHIAETAANDGYPAMAESMSQAVGDLAAQIAATLPRQ